MAEKKQLNVRIPNDLYDKIDNKGTAPIRPKIYCKIALSIKSLLNS
jgi:hypothetical protein